MPRLLDPCARTSDAMDVIVAEFWYVVVDDVRDPAHVDSATNHIGGNQQLNLPGAE